MTGLFLMAHLESYSISLYYTYVVWCHKLMRVNFFGAIFGTYFQTISLNEYSYDNL